MRSAFIAWTRYNRRSALLAQHFGATMHHIVHGRQGRVWQAPWRYVVQSRRTWRVLRAERPNVVFVQNPPLLCVLLVYIYCRCYGARYVIDSHTAAFLSPKWRWMLRLHRWLSRRAITTIVTNDHLKAVVDGWRCPSFILGFTPAEYPPGDRPTLTGALNAAVVSTGAEDEPLDVVFSAAEQLSGATFYITGDQKRLEPQLLAKKPENCILTGYLPYDGYVGLLRSVDVVIDLTTRDHTLLLGAFEAVSLGTPLIVSDWPILRSYFSSGTVHVPNTVAGLCEGIDQVVVHQQTLKEEIVELRTLLQADWERRYAELSRLLVPPPARAKRSARLVGRLVWLLPAVLAVALVGLLLAGGGASAADSAPAVLPASQALQLDSTSSALLIEDSRQSQPADAGFRLITSFYGLRLASLDLAKEPLTDAALRDETGAYQRTVFVTQATLDADADPASLQILKAAIEEGRLNLFIGSVQTSVSLALQTLTTGAIQGSSQPADARKVYTVGRLWPEVTRELSGITVTSTLSRRDFALTLGPVATKVQVLITAQGAGDHTYPLLARYKGGRGLLFASSDNPDGAFLSNPLADSFYATTGPGGTFIADRFAQTIPLMLFVRYTAGDAAWHQSRHYANLTIDDPGLRTTQMDFAGILTEATAHNFHFTLAMPPVFFQQGDPAVINLFLAHSDRLSLVQHGDNHPDYEFYRYSPTPGDSTPTASLAEQEARILEGRTRMEAFRQQTGLPYAPVMVFPFDISPSPTLALLKAYNFQATINSTDVPLDSKRSQLPLAHMYPAELAYESFPVIKRYHPDQIAYPFQLFVDRPLFIYDHKPLFDKSVTGFDGYADAINALAGDVVWTSLDDIMKHLYLEKTEPDGSMDVMMFGDDVVITNSTAQPLRYQVRRSEQGNVPLVGVTAGGTPVPYTVANGTLEIDLLVPAGADQEVHILYAAPPGREFGFRPEDVTYNRATGVVSATVHNRGQVAGPVTLGVFHGDPQQPGNLLSILTAHQIAAGGSTVLTTTVSSGVSGRLSLVLDPYGVGGNTDKTASEVEVDLAH